MKPWNPDLKKLLRRLLLLIIPIAAIMGIELFLIPMDFFTYRSWEAVTVKHFGECFPGPFYSNVSIERTELGDLAFRTRDAVPKKVAWKIDAHGYRNSSASGAYDIVIVGDSNSAGTSLTQEDLLSVKISRALGLRTYLFAPASLNDFLIDSRFIGHSHPKLVVFEQVERMLGALHPIYPLSKKCELSLGPVKIDLSGWVGNPTFNKLLVYLDRAYDPLSYQYVQSRLQDFWAPTEQHEMHDGIYFFGGAAENKPRPNEDIRRIADILSGYRDALRRRGIEFLFVPIPNKETYFYDLFPDKSEPNLLKGLEIELKARNLAFVDTLAAFKEHRKLHAAEYPYHLDDTHWNARGVEIVAGLVEEWCRKNGKTAGSH